jgi:hypothetical protein
MPRERKIHQTPAKGNFTKRQIKKAVLEVIKSRENPKIEIAPVVGNLDLEAERVLGGAILAEMSDCMVLGWDKDGDFYFASTFSDGGIALWLMEVAKNRLME